jgi:protein-disulfide isomerase
MLRTLAVVLLSSAAVAACAPKQDPDTTRRLAAIEAQLAQLQTEIGAVDTKRGNENASELAAILDHLVDLTSRVEKLEQKAPPRRRELDRAAVYAVPIAGDPTYGSPKAKVTLVMAMDFACPYCRRAWDTVEQLRQKYGADLRVVYKSLVVHPQTATHAALAACAANHQGKFHELAQLLWAKSFDAHDFADATIDHLAAEAHLDLARYRKDVAGACPTFVHDEGVALAQLGVNATPTFFINGRYLAGAQPAADFERLVDEELAKASAAIAAGVPADKYYDQEILAKGAKEPPF